MQFDPHIAQAGVDRFQTFQRRHVDLVHGRAHQDHMADRLVAADPCGHVILEEAGIGEIKAFVDPEGHQRGMCFDRVPQDIAEMLGAGDQTHFGHMGA